MNMANELKTIYASMKVVPIVKYAFAILGIGAAAAAVKFYNIEDSGKLPIITLLAMIGLMVLLFIFSSFAKSKDMPLKLAGYILLYITLASIILFLSSLFFNIPRPLPEYEIFRSNKSATVLPIIPESLKPQSDSVSARPSQITVTQKSTSGNNQVGGINTNNAK